MSRHSETDNVPVTKLVRQTPGWGLFLILVSVIFFSTMNTLVRVAETTFRAETLVFYRTLIQVGLLIPWWSGYLSGEGNTSARLVAKLRVHLLRGGFGVFSMFSLFLALRYLPLAMTSLLAMTSVFWGTLFAWVFLKERPSRAQFIFGGLTVAGVASSIPLAARSSAHWTFEPRGVAAALSCGIFMGLALTSLRKLRQSASSGEIVFYFSLFGILGAFPFFVAEPQIPTGIREWTLIGGIGLSGLLGQLLMSEGFRYTATLNGMLGVLQQIPLNIVVGLVLLNETPPTGFYGSVVLVLVGLIGLVRVSRQK